jgi:UrcA family protein
MTHDRRCPHDDLNRENPGPHRPGGLIGRLGNRVCGFRPAATTRPPVTVRYADLNLANAEGALALYRRITAAARTVCGPDYAQWYPAARKGWKHCYKATVDEAVRAVNAPTLTALHAHSINVAAR